MINKDNLSQLLLKIGFEKNAKIYTKNYSGFSIIVDFENELILYPEDKGLIVNERTTCNFSQSENFVVLECINRLFEKGYRPEHIELEKKWSLGHEEKSGRADICIKDAKGANMLCIIECKTYGQEYNKALNILKNDGGQLFSYWQQEKSTKWLVLYSSDLVNDSIIYQDESINCSDDANILLLAKKDDSIQLFKNANTVDELYEVWKETYDMNLCGDVIFNDDTAAYTIGIKPLRKKDLKDFSQDDKIVNKFEEILRHNNVSDKENAFNRLTALFICKLVDEINKSDNDVVEFQYRIGTDTYETLQDRLQKLHQQGMDEFMKEQIFYIADDYAEKIVQQYTGSTRNKLIEELNKTLKILKFYTNNDFAFKDVHNEELFYQNGKVLVEVVQLFQKFRIINSNNLQLLGDLFEQLLNKGFKQNEGQFFTPIPITRFIAKSLPISKIMNKEDKQYFPKVIDYACGAGHFLTETFEEIKKIAEKYKFDLNGNWIENKLYGVEKDYRLSRVSKIMLFMHGLGSGNIVFGDGLESYPEKGISNDSFDVLVANPPYSVAAFKPHLKLRNNKDFDTLKFISNNGSEIETLFVERISQLIKSEGVAAVILPSTILTKTSRSYISARETIIKNFNIKAIVSMGKKTFGATGTPTVILFLEKFSYPPKRVDLVSDSVNAIVGGGKLANWEDNEILNDYCKEIMVKSDEYIEFFKKGKDYKFYENHPYFSRYYKSLIKSADYKAKLKQTTYKNASSKDKLKIISKMFYELAINAEKDKLSIFSFVYKQKTLVIFSPDDNKEEKKFLGYEWSDRSGQEGIIIKNFGGKLFDNERDDNPDKFAYLINKCFDNKYLDSSKLNEYYFYSDLKKLFDFESEKFEKEIRLVEKRELKTDPDYKLYKMSQKEIFELNIGKRVLKENLVDSDAENAIPVISANVNEEFGYIDDNIIDSFDQPSILWGIDGNWMVNIIEKDKKFYPTDHCGYLRIKSNDILPEYMRYVLEVEGRYRRYSRNNRASINSLEKMSFQIPSIATQKKVMREITNIDKKINKYKESIDNNINEINKKFELMFGEKDPNEKIKTFFDVQKGTVITENKANDGDVPVVAGGKTACYYHDQANRPANIITVSASGSSGFVNFWDIPIYASDCNTIISLDEEEVSTLYLYYYLKYKQDDVYMLRTGLQPSHVYADDLKEFKFYKPSKEEMNTILDFINQIKAKNKKIVSEMEYVIAEKKLVVDKFFK